MTIEDYKRIFRKNYGMRADEHPNIFAEFMRNYYAPIERPQKKKKKDDAEI